MKAMSTVEVTKTLPNAYYSLTVKRRGEYPAYFNTTILRVGGGANGGGHQSPGLGTWTSSVILGHRHKDYRKIQGFINRNR